MNKQQTIRRKSRTRETRKSTAPLLALAFFAIIWGMQASASGFGYAQVVAQAKALAAKPYNAPQKVPPRFANLDFSHWSAIHFKAKSALWQNARFHIQFSPAGYIYHRPVNIHVVKNGKAQRLSFSPDMFHVDDKALPQGLTPDLGFAGFRLTYPLNRPDKQDELMSFLGASYFRAVPKGGWFGLSARGVAIDTVASKPERFPHFSDFWLVKPAADSHEVTVFALLNGDSIAGAYRFQIKPGAPTTVDVKATLFLRRHVEQLGLAPLTSMFFYGIGDHKPGNQSVPAIHDSDGLLIRHDRNRWTWRPLANPGKVSTVKFPEQTLHGFGLLQRDRRRQDYQDPDQHYADRPGVWIESRNDWGPGHITLVELPTTNSYLDNMVAFWTPAKQPPPGTPLTLRYRMSWRLAPVPSKTARVVSTLVGGNEKTGAGKYVIDYAGGPLKSLPADTAVKGWVHVDPGTAVTENRVLRNPHTGGWRQVIQVMPLDTKPVRIRAGLGDKKNRHLTETWDYTQGPKTP